MGLQIEETRKQIEAILADYHARLGRMSAGQTHECIYAAQDGSVVHFTLTPDEEYEVDQVLFGKAVATENYVLYRMAFSERHAFLIERERQAGKLPPGSSITIEAYLKIHGGGNG